jgi:hypothetical protein
LEEVRKVVERVAVEMTEAERSAWVLQPCAFDPEGRLWPDPKSAPNFAATPQQTLIAQRLYQPEHVRALSAAPFS